MLVRSSKTPAFWSVACPARRRFRRFLGCIDTLYGVSLPCPTSHDVPDFSSFKGFCSALLERRPHLWDSAIAKSKAGVTTRQSIALSLFLFRKVLVPPEPSQESFLAKVTSESPAPDQSFMDFIGREVPRLFPAGWDKRYVRACSNVVLNTSACYERGRGDGGVRMWYLQKGDCSFEESRKEFLRDVLSRTVPLTFRSKVRSVFTGGKWRILSVPSASMAELKPLHTIMYDHLSRFNWLLRGDATANRFTDFLVKPGEVFVSGDYESATDNLNQEVQREILRLLLQRCRTVPVGIQISALRSLSVELEFTDGAGQQHRVLQKSGQMMGHLLSFPLLCLSNYLAFKYLVPEDVPVKINGDDIVFRSSPKVYKRWAEGVGRAGLTLSAGKTLVDPRFFTLNSTLFRATPRYVRLVPVVRSSALFGVEDDRLSSLAGRYRSFTYGFTGRRRRSARGFFLQENRRYVLASKRSVSRGLGMKVCRSSLIWSGLWDRECSYLSLPMEKPLVTAKSCWSVPPEGYHLAHVGRITKEMKKLSKGVAQAFVAAAWKVGKSESVDQKGDIWFGTSRVRLSHMCSLMGLSKSCLLRRVRASNNLVFESSRSNCRRTIWLPDARPIIFRNAEHKITLLRDKPLRPLTFETDDCTVQGTLSWIDQGELNHFSGLVRSSPPPGYSSPTVIVPCYGDPDPDEKKKLMKRFCRFCGERYTVSFFSCKCGKSI